MPQLEKIAYDGFYEKTKRLGLAGLVDDVREVLSGFPLFVMEKKDSNGGAALRELIDARFRGGVGMEEEANRRRRLDKVPPRERH